LRDSYTIGANLSALHRQLADCPVDVDVGDLPNSRHLWGHPETALTRHAAFALGIVPSAPKETLPVRSWNGAV
jgi:hypothetical protein